MGKELSGALVATLVGLALSNIGLIPCDAVEYGIVNQWLLPLAVPMLLLSADLRKVLKDTGAQCLIFPEFNVTFKGYSRLAYFITSRHSTDFQCS